MLVHIFTVSLSLILYYIFSKYKFNKIIFNFLNIYKKLFKLFFSKNYSDNMKEELILKYSLNLFCKSIYFIGIFLIIIIFIYLLNYLNKSFISHILSIIGIIESIITIFIYFLLRKFLYD